MANGKLQRVYIVPNSGNIKFLHRIYQKQNLTWTTYLHRSTLLLFNELRLTGKWQQLKPMGDKLPCLQEHTAVSHKDCIYVFGGEVGFSAGSETPLWVYNIKANSWKKKRTKKGVATPKGRRGHTALVHSGTMLIYGGYQDLRGSTSELWAYHFETESWHLVSAYPSKGASDQQQQPPPRHKHSAVLHGDAMWVYGGMTDLQERSDLWKWDIASTTWLCIKSKINPGPLHSHAACKMPSCMLIFGGERNGQTCNDLWRFSFGMETWEKIIITGVKPQPRAESTAFAVSELLNCSLTTSLEYRAAKVRSRVCNSADRGHRHSSSFTHNKIAPCEKTYVFQPSQTNYNDGSELAQQFAESDRPSRSFLQEIGKLSQLNLPRVSNKCSYTVLTGSAGDSTESLLRQHASPQTEIEAIDTDIATPSRGTMVKSKSAFVIKKKYHLDVSPTQDGEPKETRKRVGFDNSAFKLPREPISVPNFSTLTLPTPVLTPVEAAKLIATKKNDILQERETEKEPENIMEGKEETVFQNFRPMRRGDSYTSHLGYADNPLYQQMINSLQEKSEENVSSTSDYYSIETVNRLSSASSYSVKTGTPQEENQKNREKDKTGPFGFCNPNYMGSDIKSVANETTDKKNAVRFLANEEIARNSDEEDILELQTFSGTIGKDTKVVYRHTSRVNGPPRSLALEKHQTNARQTIERYRALSAGRADRKVEHAKAEPAGQPGSDPYLPVYIYVIGGKEQGQVTVFQRPISIWKLKMV
ncbi:hypothetical protein NQ317_016907 [Molorchus minor]|uniref:Uncharacterized protein n=1 Tax=Molorchus minor TaxID=1323400 RepID=A0ABQ9K344_9CUCU|nr:hypothetical protein NQ317_016907 [Molorchus minor]